MNFRKENLGIWQTSIYLLILIVTLLPSLKCDSDSNEYYDYSSYTPNSHYYPTSQKRSFLENVIPKLPRLGSTPVIDPDTVYNGIIDPNNIAIHVGQNFVNFAAGTLAWFLLSFTYTERTKRSVSRNFPEAPIFPQAPIPITIKAPPPNGFGASDFSDGNWVADSSFTRSDRVQRSTDEQVHENKEKVSSSKNLANMFRSLADAADSFDR